MAESEGTATVEDVTEDTAHVPEHAEETASELAHDAADASAEAADTAQEHAQDVASAAGDAVEHATDVADDHRMHEETRRIMAEGFERVERRLDALEAGTVHTLSQPVEDVAEAPEAIVSEEPVTESTEEVHVRRRRAFGKARRR
jgi:hypothetical protein